MNKSSRRLLLSLLLVAGASLLLVHGVSAQEGAATAGSAPAQRNILQTILSSGPLGIAIWCAILGASVTMVTFVIQNILTLRTDRLAPPPLLASLRQVIGAGNYQEAWEICNANRNYLANTLKAGLERIGRGKDVFDDALAEHGLREAQMLRTRNSYLSVIGVVSPMIGLLGTVIGMMKAFTVLGGSGISDPRALASSIGEVLARHGERTVHRDPGVRVVLHFPQPRADGHRQRGGPHQLARRRRALRGTRGRAHRRKLLRGRRHPLGRRLGFAPGVHGADHQLPGVQRVHRSRHESLSELRRDPRLEKLSRP